MTNAARPPQRPNAQQAYKISKIERRNVSLKRVRANTGEELPDKLVLTVRGRQVSAITTIQFDFILLFFQELFH